jgi:hypothetical protein
MRNEGVGVAGLKPTLVQSNAVPLHYFDYKSSATAVQCIIMLPQAASWLGEVTWTVGVLLLKCAVCAHGWQH